MSQNQVCLFFCVNGQFLVHGCELADAEPYGDFLNYPYSHHDIWNKNYRRQYGVDFDYYPRGRVVYRKSDDTYLIYHDRCVEPFIESVAERYVGKNVVITYDEHYQCHLCNRNYVI